MSRYRKIHVKMWSSGDFRALSRPKPNAQTLWLHLLTGEHTTAIPGLFSAGKARLAEELEWPLRAWEKCWEEIEARGMARADWNARLVFLPSALAHNPPTNPNAVHAWRDEWTMLPPCPLRDEAEAAFTAFLATMGTTFADAWQKVRLNVPAQRPGKRSQERSQERSGEHSEDRSLRARTHAPAAPAPALSGFEGVQGEPSPADLRRAWNDALLAATAKTWPAIPDSPHFDAEREALEGLWREAAAEGFTFERWCKALVAAVREWEASFPPGRRRDWWHMPSRFLAWDNQRGEPATDPNATGPQSRWGDPSDEVLAGGVELASA
ncbi:MAG TPA: hypothetical protein VLS49_05360 [Usitatibacter sp.]|nr:hypothetical protein [Usitatibacter sp.]